jgi:hypothetical protein
MIDSKHRRLSVFVRRGGTQIVSDYLEPVANLFGLAIADLSALIEHNHMIGAALNAHLTYSIEILVVLMSRSCVEDERIHAAPSSEVRAGHRLIELQKLGLGRLVGGLARPVSADRRATCRP